MSEETKQPAEETPEEPQEAPQEAVSYTHLTLPTNSRV